MRIKTYGRTAETLNVTTTRDEVVATMKEITAVHRAKGEDEYLCPFFYAKEIVLRVKARTVEERIANQARKLADRIGRRRVVRLA